MIDSRNPADLCDTVRKLHQIFIDECAAESIDIITTSTYRDHAAQAKLYAQGRTAKGRIVTNAAPGQSFHNYRVAFDVVPLRHGKPVWGTAGDDGVLWERVGTIGEAIGLEWAGRWKRFREFPHFQYLGGNNLAWFQAGNRLP